MSVTLPEWVLTFTNHIAALYYQLLYSAFQPVWVF
jgi:hypothetical protein